METENETTTNRLRVKVPERPPGVVAERLLVDLQRCGNMPNHLFSDGLSCVEKFPNLQEVLREPDGLGDQLILVLIGRFREIEASKAGAIP